MDFSDALYWAQTSGVNLLVGIIWSWLVELFPAWERLRPSVKRILIMALCFLIPTGAGWLSQFLGYRPFSWREVLEAGWAAFFASQGNHMILAKRE